MRRDGLTEDDLKVLQANLARGKGTVGGSLNKAGRAIARPSPGVLLPTPPPLTLALTGQKFFVPGPLPGANDIIRKHHMVYSRLKAQWGLTIARCIIVAKLKRAQRCRIFFCWQEPNNRRDDDNVIFAQKFVLDALRDTKIIPDDRRQFIESLTHRVIVEPTNPGVWVTVEEI